MKNPKSKIAVAFGAACLAALLLATPAFACGTDRSSDAPQVGHSFPWYIPWGKEQFRPWTVIRGPVVEESVEEESEEIPVIEEPVIEEPILEEPVEEELEEEPVIEEPVIEEPVIEEPVTEEPEEETPRCGCGAFNGLRKIRLWSPAGQDTWFGPATFSPFNGGLWNAAAKTIKTAIQTFLGEEPSADGKPYWAVGYLPAKFPLESNVIFNPVPIALDEESGVRKDTNTVSGRKTGIGVKGLPFEPLDQSGFTRQNFTGLVTHGVVAGHMGMPAEKAHTIRHGAIFVHGRILSDNQGYGITPLGIAVSKVLSWDIGRDNGEFSIKILPRLKVAVTKTADSANIFIEKPALQHYKTKTGGAWPSPLNETRLITRVGLRPGKYQIAAPQPINDNALRPIRIIGHMLGFQTAQLDIDE